MFRSGAQFMILVLLVGLFLLRESRQPFGSELDDAFADFLSRNSFRSAQPAPVTVVEISETSLKDHPWPWTPLDFALFFQAANTFKPDALATDEVLFWDEQQVGSDQRQKLPQYEKILREHILRAPKVLLGAKLGYPDDPHVVPPLQETPVIRRVTGDPASIAEFTAIAEQAKEDYRLSTTSGFTNLRSGLRAYHSVPLLLRYRGQLVPSFVLQAVLLSEKATVDDIAVTVGEHLTIAGRLDIPIDSRGEMRVDFGVPARRCSLEELVLSSAQVDAGRDPIIPADYLDGKLVLLARTDQNAQTLTLSANRAASPGELFASGIATIQTQSFVRRVSHWFDFGVIAAAMLIALALPRWRKGPVAVSGLVLIAGYVLAALGVFGQTLIWLPILLPGGIALFMIAYRLATPVVHES